jgi:hypothetical protein
MEEGERVQIEGDGISKMENGGSGIWQKRG